MKGYVFTFGVDGFGADVAPAYEEGCYLDYDKAFAHLCELNERAIQDCPYTFYEEGYGEDYYPEDDIALRQAEEKQDWSQYEIELNKHILTDITAICNRIIDFYTPPFNMYGMEEIEIKE